MAGMNEMYPYRVQVLRTSDWYDSGGTWYKLSTWCDRTFGKGRRWEFFNSEFCFETEQDMMLFKLKWCN